MKIKNLVSSGLFYYIEWDDGRLSEVPYPTYCALQDLNANRITRNELPDRIEYYQDQEVYVDCPLCEPGTKRVSRKVAEVLEQGIFPDFHEGLGH